MAAFAAPFLAYYALLLASDLRRPESPGFAFELTSTGLVVGDVWHGSAAARAGIVPGDRIAAVNGRSIRTRSDFLAAEVNLRRGDTVRLDVERDGLPSRAMLTLEGAGMGYWATPAGLSLLAARGVQLLTMVLATLVLSRRPFDRTADVAAWMLAALAVYSITLPYGWAAHWRMLPGPAGLALWMPFACSVAAPALLFTFAAAFPRVLVRRPLAWVAAWIPMLALVVLEVRFAAGAVYHPERALDLYDWTNARVVVTVAYAVAAMSALAWGYRRSPDLTARRRIRVVITGMLVGTAATVPVVVVHWTTPFVGPGHSMFASPLLALGTLVGLAFPISFAYAVLWQRLFDVGFIIRRGLQYALARRVLVSVVPAAFVVFLADLWSNRDVPFGEVARARGWQYTVLIGVALLARTRRGEWLDSLDRRFFRERYNAQRILRAVAEEARGAPSLEAAAPRVVAEIEAALHPSFAALVRLAPHEPSCRLLAASAPIDVPLSASSTVVGLLDVLRKPLPLPTRDPGWLSPQLPAEELGALRHAGVDLLVPVAAGSDRTEVALVLGAKQSEEPYSEEDQDLLAAIASSLALALGRGGTGPHGHFQECPACGACYDAPLERCARDATPLVGRPVPRLLGGRYRLDRRLASGGMGTVYAAVDTALGRRVATKLLRDDLADAAAAARFQSEARLAASLMHPNVVTIHDLGVTACGRGFLVMELLEGVTLRRELERAGPLPAMRALRILRGVSAAVDAAHERRMVHRDLKPENIFLCRADERDLPKVLDFGLAKALEGGGGTLTRSGLVAGTPQYMAPEHLRGDEPSVDWDLWALAVIAFEMLTGMLPFTGAPPGVPRLDAAPLTLRPVFANALSPNPFERPASGRELVDGIGAALACDELST